MLGPILKKCLLLGFIGFTLNCQAAIVAEHEQTDFHEGVFQLQHSQYSQGYGHLLPASPFELLLEAEEEKIKKKKQFVFSFEPYVLDGARFERAPPAKNFSFEEILSPSFQRNRAPPFQA